MKTTLILATLATFAFVTPIMAANAQPTTSSFGDEENECPINLLPAPEEFVCQDRKLPFSWYNGRLDRALLKIN